MIRIPIILTVGMALQGCETPARGTGAPAVNPPAASACTPGPFTLADGRRIERTCAVYRGCTTYTARAPRGARSTALPFFVMRDGRPTSQYPGPENCL